MVGCCEEAIAVYKQRASIDQDPEIVKVQIPDSDRTWSFYMANNYISNALPEKEFGNPFPPYEGNARFAPHIYNTLLIELDKELMDDAGWQPKQ